MRNGEPRKKELSNKVQFVVTRSGKITWTRQVLIVQATAKSLSRIFICRLKIQLELACPETVLIIEIHDHFWHADTFSVHPANCETRAQFSKLKSLVNLMRLRRWQIGMSRRWRWNARSDGTQRGASACYLKTEIPPEKFLQVFIIHESRLYMAPAPDTRLWVNQKRIFTPFRMVNKCNLIFTREQRDEKEQQSDGPLAIPFVFWLDARK